MSARKASAASEARWRREASTSSRTQPGVVMRPAPRWSTTERSCCPPLLVVEASCSSCRGTGCCCASPHSGGCLRPRTASFSWGAPAYAPAQRPVAQGKILSPTCGNCGALGRPREEEYDANGRHLARGALFLSSPLPHPKPFTHTHTGPQLPGETRPWKGHTDVGKQLCTRQGNFGR
jgi:hypothetical protein